MFDQEIQEVIDNLAIFDKMYEIIRFVDPGLKIVIKRKANNVSETPVKCFDFWGKNSICDNCISIRAYNENKTFVKVEYNPERIYMVTAIPFDLDGRRIVIELLKDVTNSMVIGSGSNEVNNEIYAVINNMNNLALKDPLTNIYNKRYINERLPVDLINASLLDQEMSLIMADIDFFKKVNDTYGHLAGDEVIKSFANTISDCINNEGGWVSRFGGEEFLICLSGYGLNKAVDLAEYIRTAIEEKEIATIQGVIKITASFGVCSVKPKQGSTVEDLIEAADRKLYMAKNNGRNRVEY